MSKGSKLPNPTEAMVDENGLITQPWYQYFAGGDPSINTRAQIVSTADGQARVKSGELTILASTPGAIHEFDTPEVGIETTIICQVASTQSSITVRSATDVAIGPGGENALSFGTDVSTFEYVRLVGTDLKQYEILYRTTAVSVVASS